MAQQPGTQADHLDTALIAVNQHLGYRYNYLLKNTGVSSMLVILLLISFRIAGLIYAETAAHLRNIPLTKIGRERVVMSAVHRLPS